MMLSHRADSRIHALPWLALPLLLLAACGNVQTIPPSATPIPPSATPIPPSATPIPLSATPAPPSATPVPASATPVPPSPSPAVLVQSYVFPVEAPAGTINYGRAHHDYPATDIFCPIGSRFVAPTSGIIDYVSTEDVWSPKTDLPADRGGLSVAMIGDDGVRYYGSHLSDVADGIAPGVRVQAGQLLGLTGRSGNARSTPPHLHFGISHPTTPDDWEVRRGQISPYPYLRAWQRGESLQPVLG